MPTMPLWNLRSRITLSASTILHLWVITVSTLAVAMPAAAEETTPANGPRIVAPVTITPLLAEARRREPIEGQDVEPPADVYLGGKVVLTVFTPSGEQTPIDRARVIAQRLNDLLKPGVDPTTIRVEMIEGEGVLLLGNRVLATVDVTNAELQETTPEKLAALWRANIIAAVKPPPTPPDKLGQSDKSASIALNLHPVRRILDNGLTVIVHENHLAPVVAIRCYVRTGSMSEGRWLGSGISHLLEHTLMSGTKRRTRTDIERLQEQLGNRANAYTTRDLTCYHITTSSRYFDEALDLMADSLQNAAFPQAELASQREIILKEMRMAQDDADQVAFDLLYATMFRRHPARHPILGYPRQFERLTRDDVLAYYRLRYTPRNTVIVVAGDIVATEALAGIEKRFAEWSGQAPSAPAPAPEPVQVALRRATANKDVEAPRLLMGWRTVSLVHPDLYALDLLAVILGKGDSARLPMAVRDRLRLVDEISAWSYTPGYDAGVFGIEATVVPGKSRDAETAILAQVSRLQSTAPSVEELAKAVRLAEADYLFSLETADEQAEALAADEIMAGDVTFSQHYLERLRQVRPAQIRTVVQRYLTPENLTVVVVGNGAFGVSPPDTIVQATAPPKPAIRRVKLDNGAVILCQAQPQSPTVTVMAGCLGGVRFENEETNGICRLVSQLLVRGAGQRSADAVAREVDEHGARLEPFSGYNSFGVTMEVLARDVDFALHVVIDAVRRPHLDVEEFARERGRQLSAIRRRNDDPFGFTEWLCRRSLYRSHPYRLAPLGDDASLRSLTHDDVVGFHRSYCRPSNFTLAVFGGCEPEGVIAAARRLLADWSQPGPPLPSPGAEGPLTTIVRVNEERPEWTQTVVELGYRGTTVDEPERYVLDVLDAALSGIGLPGGRLHTRLRKAGLVYVVHAENRPGLEPGDFTIYAATSVGNEARVIEAIDAEIRDISKHGIDAGELKRAQRMCISAHEVDLERNEARAQRSLLDELYHLGYEDHLHYVQRIEKVRAAEVQQAAQRFLDPDHRVITIVRGGSRNTSARSSVQ